jgi:hypothetical protein
MCQKHYTASRLFTVADAIGNRGEIISEIFGFGGWSKGPPKRHLLMEGVFRAAAM